ncbi:MAG: hypothetical protein HYR76_07955 [Ignavibacteria bacterium]|nr:hypothetical protein [Ignavibacteria bacterium]
MLPIRQAFFLTAFVVLVVFTAKVAAQEFHFQSYVVHDGLPSNYITALCQDSRGYLWIGTDNGLSLYDGTEFRNFTTTDGLPNLFITTIFEQRRKPGTMWMGTIAGGIVRLDGDKCISIPVGDNNLVALHQDATGTLWCSTRDHVYQIRNDSAVIFQVVSDRITDIQSMGDSVVVFLGRSEILFYQVQGHTLRRRRLGLTGNEFASTMLVDNDGIIWVITSKGRLGKMSLEGLSFRQLQSTFVLSENLPSNIIDDGRGTLWVTPPAGILRIDKATYASTIINEPGKRFTILSGPIILDREKNMWIGTSGDGLLKLTDQRVIRIPIDGISAGSANLSATSDTNGHIWLLTYAGLWEVYRSNSGEWKKHQHYPKPRAGGILVDPKGRLWELETELGQYWCYEIIPQQNAPSKLKRIGSISVGSPGGVTPGLTFTITDKNRGWFAVNPTGLVEVDVQHAQVLRRFSSAEGLFENPPRAVLVDREGNVWSGTWTTGLNVLHHGAETFRAVLEFPALSGSGVRSLYEDREGSLWIGTRYSGLVHYQHGKFTGTSVKDGLLSNAIWCIAETGDRVWCGTDVGLESVSKATGIPLPKKNDLIGERVFACGAYRNEYVWAVLANTLVIFHEPEAHVPGIPPPIYIKSFSVNGALIASGGPYEFPHDQNSSSFEYVGLSFKDEHAVRYRYRMLGVDSAWTAPSKQHSVTFASLTPGSYTFEVSAVNPDGITSTTPASIRFVIIPPVWKQWWFIALVALAIVLVLVLLYRYRVARLLEMERLRTRISADLHDDVGTNLSDIVIASQIMQREALLSDREQDQLAEIRQVATSTQEMMRDIVWMLNPKNDSLDDFLLKMKEVAARLLPDIRYTFLAPGKKLRDRVSIEFKRNIFLIFKESLNNIVRHSSATEVAIEVKQSQGMFTMQIRDNGRGFDIDEAVTGSGLANLRRRAGLIDGKLDITSNAGKGTTITLTVKNHAFA